jgi:hypothetical protein
MALGITEAVDLTKRIADLVKAGATLEAQEHIVDLREAVLNVKGELIQSREDNQRLREQLAEKEIWEQRAAKYTLIQAPGGAVVYSGQEPLSHYACPRCFEKRQIQILQDGRNAAGSFKCSGCDKSFPVNPVQRYEREPPAAWCP